jgi:hypothetical protein
MSLPHLDKLFVNASDITKLAGDKNTVIWAMSRLGRAAVDVKVYNAVFSGNKPLNDRMFGCGLSSYYT